MERSGRIRKVQKILGSKVGRRLKAADSNSKEQSPRTDEDRFTVESGRDPKVAEE